MFFWISIGIALVICIVAILCFVPETTEEVQLIKNEEDDHREYHKEKYNKIKEQYYRSIDLEEYNKDFEQPTIVGIDAPQGKWSRMVIMRNMQYITTLKGLMGNNFQKMGIWQLKVKAQQLISHAFHRGKGR